MLLPFPPFFAPTRRMPTTLSSFEQNQKDQPQLGKSLLNRKCCYRNLPPSTSRTSWTKCRRPLPSPPPFSPGSKKIRTANEQDEEGLTRGPVLPCFFFFFPPTPRAKNLFGERKYCPPPFFLSTLMSLYCDGVWSVSALLHIWKQLFFPCAPMNL